MKARLRREFPPIFLTHTSTVPRQQADRQQADWLPRKPADILTKPADKGSGDGDWAELGCSGPDFRERFAVGVINHPPIRRTKTCRMIHLMATTRKTPNRPAVL
jgi:hypothetical protein